MTPQDIANVELIERLINSVANAVIRVLRENAAPLVATPEGDRGPATIPQCGVPEPVNLIDPVPQGTPSTAPPPDDTLSATKRVRRTKAQIAADNAAIGAAPAERMHATPPGTPASAPAPAEPGTELSADKRKELRLELSEAVRASLAMNGEQETVRRLGYPKISMVPDNFLPVVIKAMKA